MSIGNSGKTSKKFLLFFVGNTTVIVRALCSFISPKRWNLHSRQKNNWWVRMKFDLKAANEISISQIKCTHSAPRVHKSSMPYFSHFFSTHAKRPSTCSGLMKLVPKNCIIKHTLHNTVNDIEIIPNLCHMGQMQCILMNLAKLQTQSWTSSLPFLF